VRQVVKTRRFKAISTLRAGLYVGTAFGLVGMPATVFAGAGDGIPFSITVDGDPVSEGARQTEEDILRKTDVDLSEVDIQVKFDGLEAKPLLNVSTTPMRRSYQVGEKVTFLSTSNYPAFIDRSEIRIYPASGPDMQTPVAVVPTGINDNAVWRMPAGPDGETEYNYVLRVYDEAGRFDETVPLTLQRTSRAFKPAATLPVVAVAPGMGEDRTARRNLNVHGGAVTVYGRQVPEGHRVSAFGENVPIDGDRAFVVQRILPPGDHEVGVAVQGLSKASALDFNRQINIPDNEWFYVALADLTVGKRMGDADIETVRPGEYNDIYTNGRLAFYVKGKIKGRYLLTAAGDTGDDKLENMFRGLDSKDPRQLLRRLDPDDYYPVYGDDSTMIEDAPTNGKFFVRLERGDSHVMWGNYKTQITGTEFIRSDRALYGASAVYRSADTTSFGARKGEVTLYAAQPDTLPQRDQFLGTGGSAYFMKRQDITVGSETVTVEIRDGVTGRIIERRSLAYGQDYTFDYMQGVMILKQPLWSSTGTSGPVRDGALGGNKVFVVAQYEYTPLVSDVDGYVYGGRGQQWLTDKVRVGVTGMNETTGEADQRAYGADLQLRHSEKTFLEAEVARSSGPGFSTSSSYDGGLTMTQTGNPGGLSRDATAWRVRGQIDLKDIVKDGPKGTVGGYYEDMQAGFSTLSEQIWVDQQIWGAHADVELTDRVGLGLVYDAFSDADGKRKNEGKASVRYRFDEHWEVSVGASHTELVSPLAVASGKSGQDGSRVDAGARLAYRANDDWSAYVFGQGTLDRSGDIRRNDRVGVGGETRVTDKIGLKGEVSYGTGGVGGLAGVTYDPTADDHYYIGYRLDPDRAFDADRHYDLVGTDRGAIVGGTRRKIGDDVSAYAENSYDMFGQRQSLTQTYGVVYTPDTVWTLDGGLEVGTIRDSSIDPATGFERADFDRTAVSMSVGYNDEPAGISGRIRGEARFEDSDDNSRDLNSYLFAAGLSWKTSEDWRMIGKIDAVLSDSAAGSYRDGDYIETSLGYAYRPVDNDRLNALFKYTWLFDQPGLDQVDVNGSLAGPKQRTHILSVDAIYDLVPWLSIGGKYGFRIGEVQQRITDGSETFTGWENSSAHLGVVRADLHIVKEWDVLLEGRALFTPSADTTDYGALVALYRHVGENFKVGVGYNFGRFSDDLRDQNFDDRGAFLNVVGKL
jgi:hypothetical protein